METDSLFGAAQEWALPNPAPGHLAIVGTTGGAWQKTSSGASRSHICRERLVAGGVRSDTRFLSSFP